MEETHPQHLKQHEVLAHGPPPFITHRVYRLPNGQEHHWHSRHHRKGLVETDLRKVLPLGRELLKCLWMPHQLNWWIGWIFALGASLFLLGSVLSLYPAWAAALGLSSAQVSAIFFLGSIPFTTAAYLQLYQAANAGVFSLAGRQRFRKRYWFGWRPNDLGWWSCALQFVGTILFNFNTFDALWTVTWWVEDMTVWTPNVLGSILFLVSGYFAFAEQCHAYWKWDWKSLSWLVVFTNLLGCIAFMISAGFAIGLPRVPDFMSTASLVATGLGAIGFLSGSLLMLPETVIEVQEQQN